MTEQEKQQETQQGNEQLPDLIQQLRSEFAAQIAELKGDYDKQIAAKDEEISASKAEVSALQSALVRQAVSQPAPEPEPEKAEEQKYKQTVREYSDKCLKYMSDMA